MITLAEIKELKDYYTGDLYVNLRAEQKMDASYIDDTFDIPEVKSPHTVFKYGHADKIVSSAAEQLVTSNPQAFITTDKKTDKPSGDKIGREVNEVWMTALKRQTPSLFKELVKNKIGRGESFIRLSHNELWVTGKKLRYGLPVIFSAPDPMIIYASPNDDDSGWIPRIGIPNRVIVCYPRQPIEVVRKYPSWVNPKNRHFFKVNKTDKADLVDWWEYWDKDVRYFEADGQAVLKSGIQPNDYGFTPFVHKYSGFGKESPDGDLSYLAVSDIRKSRDLIKEASIVGSDIASILHLFAHQPVTVILPSGEEINEVDLKRNFDMGSYALNLLFLPPGYEIKWGGNIIPGPEMFNHYRDIVSEIYARYPFMNSAGFRGTSGRETDLASMTAMRRYETVTDNTEDQVATAVEMAIQICKKIPKLIPDSLSKSDLEINCQCKVILRADDPLEADRKATLGSRLYQQGEIDLETNLVSYQNKTQDEARNIMDKRMVDNVIMNDPIIGRLIAIQTAKEMGMEEQYTALEQQMGAMQKGLEQPPQIGSQGGQPRVGNIQTPTGQNQIDMSLYQKGARQPPAR